MATAKEARDKLRGTAIKGSALVRDFCGICGEPIRVAQVYLDVQNYCSDCTPKPGRQKAKDLRRF